MNNNPANSETEAKSDLQVKLLNAADNGDWETARRLIEAGTNVNIIDASDWTPLHYAAVDGDPKKIALLLDEGADPNLGAANSPLILAASTGHLSAVKLLISHGAKLETIWGQEMPFTPLMWAASFGHAEICRYLVSQGAVLEHRGIDRVTSLLEAAGEGRLEATEALLQIGADIAAVDVNASTIMHYCAKGALLPVILELLDLGGNINSKNAHGETPLHWAFDDPLSVDFVYSLIELGADQYAYDNSKVLPCENSSPAELPAALWVVDY